MGLAERWYMQDRDRLPRAYREHRPRERPSNTMLVGHEASASRFSQRLMAFGLAVESLLVGTCAVLAILWFWHVPH